jgi:putative ATP-binding cassette transporter
MVELYGAEVDNPDQRIQEDVRDFVASALGLSLSLLGALATLVSFGGFLWSLSTAWPLRFGGGIVQVPGLMLWVAVAYAGFSMWITHMVGRRLVPINYDRLRLEADFRYGLVHFRDNAVTTAIARGERVEQRTALERFQRVVTNWWQLVRAQRNLTLLTGGIGQANGVLPIMIAAPGYFARLITLGSVVQIRIAYGQVSGALSWFVFAYQEIARWRANIERLSTLSESLDAAERTLATAGIRVVATDDDALRLDALRIEEPDGRLLLDAPSATVVAGDHIAIVGPSGTGKTLLMRAVAGAWPFGAGCIEVPGRARMLFLTQRPYMPLGTLRAAASYPAEEGSFPDERVIETLQLLGLARLEVRLGEVETWDQILSAHEQQRLALVRVLLHAPDWIFLDKATSALDEEMERQAYGLILERLPAATIVSIAHHPAVAKYHARVWRFTPAAGHALLEVT